MRKAIALALLLIVAATLLASPSFAQDNKPFAVVSVKSYDGLMDGVGKIGEIVGLPQAAMMVQGPIMQLTQGQGLAGVDTKRPWGATFTFVEGGSVSQLAFLPVTDFQALLKLSPLPAEDVGGGIYEINMGGPAAVLLVKQQGDWAFLTSAESAFESLPEDPAALLGELPSKYLVATRLAVQEIPEDVRQQWVDFFHMMSNAGGQFGPGGFGEADEDAPVPAQVQQIQMLLEESKDYEVGLLVDDQKNELVMEIVATAVDGSALAASYNRYQETESAFSGLLSLDAPFSLLVAQRGEMTGVEKEALSEQQEELKANLIASLDEDESLPNEAKAMIGQALSDLIDVGYDTLKSGSVDFGYRAELAPSPNVVAGGSVVDGKAVDGAIKRLGKLLEGGEGIPQIDWDADTIDGHSIHRVSIPISEDERDDFGPVLYDIDELTIIAAIADKSVFMAAGGAPEELLKKVMAESKAGASKKRLPFEMTVSAKSVLDWLVDVGTRMANDENGAGPGQQEMMMMQMLAQSLAASQGKDHLRITAESIPDGSKSRIIIEEGLLQLMQMPMQMMMMGAQGGPFPGQ